MAENKIKQRVFYALFIPTLCVFSMGFVFVLMQWFHVDAEIGGIWPRTWKGVLEFLHILLCMRRGSIY